MVELVSCRMTLDKKLYVISREQDGAYFDEGLYDIGPCQRRQEPRTMLISDLTASTPPCRLASYKSQVHRPYAQAPAAVVLLVRIRWPVGVNVDAWPPRGENDCQNNTDHRATKEEQENANNESCLPPFIINKLLLSTVQHVLGAWKRWFGEKCVEL